jgi:hypothetical protein
MLQAFDAKGMGKKSFVYSLFHCWHTILEDYEKTFYPWDLGYHYRERTNIGFLAAAAVKKGCLVLQEFMCQRRRRGKRRIGRGDLWIHNTLTGREYQFEAKWIERNVKTRDIKQEVQKALKKALNEVNQVPSEDRPKKSGGIVFVVPYIPKGYEYDVEDLRHELLDLTSMGADFSAIHFCGREVSECRYQRPCVAVIGKYI